MPEHNVPYKLVTQGQLGELEAFMKRDTRYIIKPLHGQASRGVALLGSPSQARDLFDLHGPLLVEQCVEGQEYSLETFTQKGHTELIAITKKYKKQFVETGHDNIPITAHAMSKNFSVFCDTLMRKLNYTHGAAHTEVIVEDKTHAIKLIETHSRPGGDYIWKITQMSTGFNMIDATIKNLLGLPYEKGKGGEPHSVRFVMPKREGRIHSLSFLKDQPFALCEICVEKGGFVHCPPLSSDDRLALVMQQTSTLEDNFAEHLLVEYA